MIAELKQDGTIALQLKRILPFPRELVFEAWQDKEQLLQWMGPTDDISLGFIEVDPQPEGRYRFGFDDGECSDQRSYVHGEFLSIVRPEQLIFTWIWEPPLPEAGVITKVTVDFLEVEGGTELTLTHQKFMDEESCEKHRVGWVGTFDQMEVYLSKQNHNDQDYYASMTTAVSQEVAFKAVAEQMSDWWTPMSAQFLSIGDQAKTDFGGESYWVFKALELDSYQRIVLQCCEANHIHQGEAVDMREEWLNTQLHFEFTPFGEKTVIKFTHKGLVPTLNCYGVCKAGWDHYILTSLKNYLEHAAGQPNTY